MNQESVEELSISTRGVEDIHTEVLVQDALLTNGW